MPRIFLQDLDITNNRISITGEKARYLASVLRCRVGDDLTIFDGTGTCFKTTITKAEKREVIAELVKNFVCDIESPLDLILAQGLLKGEKMDLVIQKATELGIKEIIPLVTDRSQLKDTKKIARWEKIAGEASRQSGRSIVPLIHRPAGFADFLENQCQKGTKGFIFWEEEGLPLNEAINKVATTSGRVSAGLRFLLVIGPEGGFTKEEVAAATEKGLFSVSLGKRILRAETAAISAVALAQFLLGDLGQQP